MKLLILDTEDARPFVVQITEDEWASMCEQGGFSKEVASIGMEDFDEDMGFEIFCRDHQDVTALELATIKILYIDTAFWSGTGVSPGATRLLGGYTA